MRNGSTRHKHFALNSLKANKIAKFERRCNEFHSHFVQLALETYGGTSEKFDKLLEKLSSKAAEFNNIPYPILLHYWKKRISTALQIGNVLSSQKHVVASLILEQKYCNVIMITLLLIECLSNQQ